jgi:hypothetical protein
MDQWENEGGRIGERPATIYDLPSRVYFKKQAKPQFINKNEIPEIMHNGYFSKRRPALYRGNFTQINLTIRG